MTRNPIDKNFFKIYNWRFLEVKELKELAIIINNLDSYEKFSIS